MTRLKKWAGWASALTAVAVGGTLALSGVAMADNIQDTITDTGASVTLVAGSSTSSTAWIKLIGNSSQGDTDPGCNVDAGENPLKLDIVTPAGVTASPDPLEITSCGTDFTVSFLASRTAQSGHVTVTIISGPAGDGSYLNQVDIPITITQPPPSNTKPTVAVAGVSDGAEYEIGSVPVAGCDVTDAEDSEATATPVIDDSALSHGLGQVTVTCDYTDDGGLTADTATATYEIVDTGDPSITHVLTSDSTMTAYGWYNQDVTVDFTCTDSGSGVASCTPDRTFGEGADQGVTGTATDWAGNINTDIVSGINVDKTAPTVSLVGGPVDGASYYYGDVPPAPTCEARDQSGLSGLDGVCQVDATQGGGSVGTHSYQATVSDKAGNQAPPATVSYTVAAWTIGGFYKPVDMGGVWNTVKGGSTVPLKFEVFAGSTEKTDTSAVKTFTQKTVACPNSTASVDEIELVTSGGTSLRYDTTAGQFVQNWATPKKPGTCYTVTMTTQDGSSKSANFILK